MRATARSVAIAAAHERLVGLLERGELDLAAIDAWLRARVR